MTPRHLWAFPLAAALLLGAASEVQGQGRGQGAPPSSLMARLRSFLGLQPRLVSVGGTRSAAELAVCLLSPGPIEPGRDGPVVRLLDPQPALVLGTPLNEIELRRGETVLWSKLASSKEPISGRLAWPLPAMQAGEQLELALRPKGASGGDWAVLSLKAASSEDQQRYKTALQASGSNGTRRLQLLDQAAAAGEGALAQALLWAPPTASNSGLAALQREQQANCKTTASTR